MTIFSSKKPTNNNNRDASAIQQPSQLPAQQQQPSQQPPPQQTSLPVLTRTRTSRDDEHPNAEVNLTDDTNETTDVSSSTSNLSGTNNSHSMPMTTTATTSMVFATNSKRKSNQHLNQAISKQTRRRCPSIGENSSSNEENHPSSSLITTNPSSDENDQHNSEDEYEQGTVKYDRNNLTEVSELFFLDPIFDVLFF